MEWKKSQDMQEVGKINNWQNGFHFQFFRRQFCSTCTLHATHEIYVKDKTTALFLTLSNTFCKFHTHSYMSSWWSQLWRPLHSSEANSGAKGVTMMTQSARARSNSRLWGRQATGTFCKQQYRWCKYIYIYVQCGAVMTWSMFSQISTKDTP